MTKLFLSCNKTGTSAGMTMIRCTIYV